MKILSKFMIVGLLMGCVLFSSQDVSAGNPLKKLGRGVANTVFGFVEIPCKIYDVNHEEGAIASVTYGVFLGIGYFLAREAVGVTEIVTFPVPLPGCTDNPKEVGWGYGPIMEPEWVIDQDHNIFNIFYDDTPMMQ